MIRILLVLVCMMGALLIMILIIILRADTSDNFPLQEGRSKKGDEFGLVHYLAAHDIKPDSLVEDFPYDTYIDSANIWSIVAIRDDIKELDEYSAGISGINRRAMANALTTKLAPRLSHYFDSYKPDSLMRLVQWAENFNPYSEVDTENRVLYQAVYNYWFDTLSSRMEQYTVNNPSLKYDFKFRYLRSRFIERRFNPPVKVTSYEKAMDNLIYSNWGHLIKASYNQTSKVEKIIFIIIVIITLYGYSFVLSKLYRLLFKKNKNE